MNSTEYRRPSAAHPVRLKVYSWNQSKYQLAGIDPNLICCIEEIGGYSGYLVIETYRAWTNEVNS